VGRVEVKKFYDVYKDSIPPVPENYTFSIIDIPFLSGELSENRAYNLLDSLRNLVLYDEASFDSLAKIYSQDPGSAISGGRLGFTERGTLVQNYEEAAYALHPNELSFPIRSEFGYHLIRLIDKRGEKISSQHILVPVSFSNIDKEATLSLARLLYKKTINDPFVFDSISIEYKNIYNNYSGVYANMESDDIHYFLLNHLTKQDQLELSIPIETENSYVLIYLYKYNEKYLSNLDNSWNLIYQYALQKKQNLIFQNLLEKMKKNIYIKIF
jgi:peptidyl-prolyl cis-trans isomerase SurA